MSQSDETPKDFTAENDPFALFGKWLKDAQASEPNDPNGVAVATVDEDGLPNVRMVLMKEYDLRGFVFYTNFESQKGRELLGQPKAAMCFHWKSLRRQVRLRGPVEVVSEEEADALMESSAKGFPCRVIASSSAASAATVFELLDKAIIFILLQFEPTRAVERVWNTAFSPIAPVRSISPLHSVTAWSSGAGPQAGAGVARSLSRK